jgi:hypothetical protein
MCHPAYSIIARNLGRHYRGALFIASNETVELVCGSVGVGDVLPDTGIISCVDPQSIALDVDPPFMEPEFMPEYEATFGDERAEDSADNRPVLELSKKDKSLLQ